MLLGIDVPYIDTGINTPAQASIACMIVLYAIAALFNLRDPAHGSRAAAAVRHAPSDLVRISANATRLWDDKLGQISLATTTLFWGAGGNLRYIVLAWAAARARVLDDQGVAPAARGGRRHGGRRAWSPRPGSASIAPPA